MCTEDKDKFENIAKELGCDESDDALDRAVEDLNLESKKDEDQKEEQDVLPLGVYTNRSGAGTSSIITGYLYSLLPCCQILCSLYTEPMRVIIPEKIKLSGKTKSQRFCQMT